MIALPPSWRSQMWRRLRHGLAARAGQRSVSEGGHQSSPQIPERSSLAVEQLALLSCQPLGHMVFSSHSLAVVLSFLAQPLRLQKHARIFLRQRSPIALPSFFYQRRRIREPTLVIAVDNEDPSFTPAASSLIMSLLLPQLPLYCRRSEGLKPVD